MDAQQIKDCIAAMAASDLDEMEISHDGWTLRLVRRSTGVQVAAAQPASASVSQPARADTGYAPPRAAPATGPHEVRAPMFGIVHLQSAPGEAPFVQPGDLIEAGALLCTLEAMKVFNEVRAETGGRISSVAVASGVEVDAGQPLFVIEPVHDV